MKISDIQLDSAGFERLVKYLHSAGNVAPDITQPHLTYHSFCLDGVETFVDHVSSKPVMSYKLSLVSTSKEPNAAQVRSVLNELIKLYVKRDAKR